MREGLGACIGCDLLEQRCGTRPGSHVPGRSGEVFARLPRRRWTGCRYAAGHRAQMLPGTVRQASLCTGQRSCQE